MVVSRGNAAIVAVVNEYTKDLRQPNRKLDEFDIPRLRAMLMIITVAGWPVQVLPCYDPIQTETHA